MKNIKHPHGNIRSFFLKLFKKNLQIFIRVCASLFCKLDKNDEIIISSATHTLGIKIKNSNLILIKLKILLFWTDRGLIHFGNYQKIYQIKKVSYLI